LGGTGVAGRLTVAELRRRGHEVRMLSRRACSASLAGGGIEHVAGDLLTGAGLAEALSGVDTVVDTSNFATMNYDKAAGMFEESMRRLGELGAEAGVKHLVVLSIVGVDKAPYGYYGAKLRHEKAALAGPVPATVVRATQFHDFPAQIVGQLRLGPVVLVPSMRTQPVATAEVAAALADAVEAGPAAGGFAPYVGGPRVERMPDLVRRVVRSRHQRILVLGLPLPGKWGRAIRTGDALLPDGIGGRGPAFDEWLRQHPARWRPAATPIDTVQSPDTITGTAPAVASAGRCWRRYRPPSRRAAPGATRCAPTRVGGSGFGGGVVVGRPGVAG
jgi:uncharacterized protein YbjT (DUF2867 family)